MRRWDTATVMALGFLTLLTLGVRLAIVVPAGFPLNDGGLFYAMIGDVISSRLALPVFSSYNAAAIPFAYPPLAFYVCAVLNLVTHVSVLNLLEWMPAVVSAASIPVFYLLAQDLLGNRIQAVLATLVFSLLPRAFEWMIMGGGITRTFGMLFALWAMHQVLTLFRARSLQAILSSVVAVSLVVLSHPEAAAHTALTVAVFYIVKDHSRIGLRDICLVALGVLVLTAPWWGTVLARHGIAPFLASAAAASEDSYNALAGLFALFRFDFADEPFVTILTVLGLLGLVYQLFKRQYLLPLWFFVMHTLEPRGGTLFMMIPLAMSAGVAFDEIVLPPFGLRAAGTTTTAEALPDTSADWLRQFLRAPAVRIVVGLVLVYGVMAAYATGWRIRQDFTVTNADLAAFHWVEVNAPEDSRFALITQGLALRDASSEWFPALTGRRSIATVFGFEWIQSADFAGRIERYRSLQTCAFEDTGCLEAWSREQQAPFDYVYVREPEGINRAPLNIHLAESADYSPVFSSSTVVIFKKR